MSTGNRNNISQYPLVPPGDYLLTPSIVSPVRWAASLALIAPIAAPRRIPAASKALLKQRLADFFTSIDVDERPVRLRLVHRAARFDPVSLFSQKLFQPPLGDQRQLPLLQPLRVRSDLRRVVSIPGIEVSIPCGPLRHAHIVQSTYCAKHALASYWTVLWALLSPIESPCASTPSTPFSTRGKKHEQVSAHRIALQRLLHHQRKTGEAFAHVRMACH